MCSFLCDILSLSLSPKRTLPSAEVGRSRRDMGEQERKALWISIDLGCCLESKVSNSWLRSRDHSRKREEKKNRNCLNFSSKEENEKQRTNANARSPFSSIEHTQMSSSLAFQASALSARSAVRRGSRAVRDFLSFYFLYSVLSA